jgi:hypothetical protein
MPNENVSTVSGQYQIGLRHHPPSIRHTARGSGAPTIQPRPAAPMAGLARVSGEAVATLRVVTRSGARGHVGGQVDGCRGREAAAAARRLATRREERHEEADGRQSGHQREQGEADLHGPPPGLRGGAARAGPRRRPILAPPVDPGRARLHPATSPAPHPVRLRAGPGGPSDGCAAPSIHPAAAMMRAAGGVSSEPGWRG